MIALVDNVEIAYDDVGTVQTGYPLVFLHAFPLNRTMWDPQVSAFVAENRCVAIDARGFGESTVNPPFSVDRYADDVVGVLDALGIDRAVLLGVSFGGYVALALWRRHPDRIRALVLAGTHPGADTPEQVTRRREMIEIAATQGSTAIANLQIAGVVGKTTRERQPDTYDAIHRMMAQSDPRAIVGALQAMIDRPDSTPLLRTIDVPTLIVVGDQDVLTPPKMARAMHQGISGSRLEVLAESGHLANMERPAAFNAVLAEFLSSLRYN